MGDTPTPTVTEDSLRYLFEQSNRFLIETTTATHLLGEEHRTRHSYSVGATLDEDDDSIVEMHHLENSTKLTTDEEPGPENSIHDVQALSIYLSDTVLKNNASGYCTTATDGCHKHQQSIVTATTITITTTTTNTTSNHDSDTILLFGHDSLPLIRK